jgi:hypothetical protein
MCFEAPPISTSNLKTATARRAPSDDSNSSSMHIAGLAEALHWYLELLHMLKEILKAQ